MERRSDPTPSASAAAAALEEGAGRRYRLAVLFWTLAAILAAVAHGAPAEIRVGIVEILTADDFEGGRSERVVTIVSSRGERTILELPAGQAEPPEGARVAVRGSGDSAAFDAESIEILDAFVEEPAISGTTSVIVILIKFTDTTTEPYTVTQTQSTVFGATGSVAAYYAETSYGSHTLAGLVTNWLTADIPTPTTCNYSAVASQAEAKATAAGYNPSAYQKHVYVFPQIPCGWAGLGGGSQAWINQALNVLVVGHELGHCFGLGHAKSLDCGAIPIGGSCTVGEYGDRFSIMGNSGARHLNPNFKNQLGYLPAGTLAVHSAGDTVYTLSVYENPGGSLYAIQIPLPAANRTYWLEYRQSIGFDSGIGANPTNGVILRAAPASDFGCSSCLLDMTPATTTFGDAALEVGQSFTDPPTGLRISPLSRDATSLNVRVEFGPSPPFGVDRHVLGGYSANLNSVLEAGEGVTVEPSYENTGGGPISVTGTATSLIGPGGAGVTYTLVDTTADYGSVPAGEQRSCYDATQNCCGVSITGATRPAAHWDATFEETLSTAAVRTWPLHVGGSFADTPSSRFDYRYAETLFHHGITSGCAASAFCPDAATNRAQMAMFLLRVEHGGSYVPPPATGLVFGDVPASAFAAAYIERLYAEGITLGCGGGNYCPNDPVTRAQMAVLVLRTKYGPAHTPPPAQGIFSDVPAAHPFAPWIEQLYAEGITDGCAPSLYCPWDPTLRGQMAVFLTRAFTLLLYGP